MKKWIPVTVGCFVGISATFGQFPTLDWANKNNGNSTSQTNQRTIDSDNSGNIFGGGYFSGPVDFDPGVGVNNIFSSTDAGYLQKLDSSGNLAWVYTFKSIGGYSQVFKMSVNDLGVVTVIGVFSGTVDFDPTPSTFNLTSFSSSLDMFVAQYDQFGVLTFAKQIGSASTHSVTPYDLELDSAGKIHICGGYSGLVDFDPSVGNANFTSTMLAGGFTTDIFVLKLDENGNYLFNSSIGNTDHQIASSIGIKSTGNIVVVGHLSGSSLIDFNTGVGVNNLNPMDGQTFILELDGSGGFSWAKNYGNGLNDEVAINSFNEVYTTGGIFGSPDMDPGTGISSVNSLGATDIYVLKLDAAGNFQWVNTFGGSLDESSSGGIALDGSGNVIVGGYFQSPVIDMDPGSGVHYLNSSTPASNTDGFITSLSSLGAFRYAIPLNGNAVQINHINVAVDDGVLCAGLAYDSVDFDPSLNNEFYLGTDSTTIFGFAARYSYCTMSSSNVSATGCGTYLSPSGNYVWSSAGTYIDTISNNAGCDSIISINLIINSIDVSVSFLSGSFTVGQASATYQWMDCSTFAVVSGATSQTFAPTTNGGYACIVTYNGCTDTTNCYNITDVGIEDNNHVEVSIYPNPSSDFINIKSNEDFRSLELLDITGKVVFKLSDLNQKEYILNVQNLSSGYYMVHVNSKSGKWSRKVSVQ